MPQRPVIQYPQAGPRPAAGWDSMRDLQQAPPSEPSPRSLRAVSRGVFAVMRRKNWLMGLAAPILAAVTVGIAAVVVTGGGSSGAAAPSALAAGFPPARLAGSQFQSGGAARVILAALGAAAGTEVAAGSADGGPALWVSADGGTDWAQASLNGQTALAAPGTGQLTAVAHGAAGWLAVGATTTGSGGPIVVSSASGQAWTVDSLAGLNSGSAAAGVAAGAAGYVIVGHQPVSGAGEAVAAAWYASGLAGWQAAAVSQRQTADGQLMNAVTATAGGFAAVGAEGTGPAAWLSASGREWQEVQLPVPASAARSALDYVSASGGDIVAAGTEFTPDGASQPFAEVSANAGATWSLLQLPLPGVDTGTGTTVTALTTDGGGFTAVGTYVTAAGPEVVVWTLGAGSPVTDGSAWTALAPQGTGLAGSNSENAITALAADGATLTGVGFTVTPSASGTQQPTLWQSPIR
jgi:hypothetical protein